MEPTSFSFLLGQRTVHLQMGPQSPFGPTTTVLQYLRSHHDRKGSKEGCGQGDCGACTVVLSAPEPGQRLRYQAVNSCLLFLPMLQGKQLITIEDLSLEEHLHPIQQAFLDHQASQCGFCSPGVIMTLFAMSKERKSFSLTEIREHLSGNLCRCTGYQNIIAAAHSILSTGYTDQFDRQESQTLKQLLQLKQPAGALKLESNHTTYWRPGTLKEALAIKSESPVARIVAGATDLGLIITKKREIIPEILDISGLEELQVHDHNPSGLILGSGITINQAIGFLEQAFPSVAALLRQFASYPIRNRATLGGNIATASPVGDLLPAFMACQTTVLIENAYRRKKARLDEFVRDYRRTYLHPDEIITGFMIPFPPSGSMIWCHKVSKRREMDIATVSAGFRFSLSSQGLILEASLYFGGMAATVQRAHEAEQFLEGKSFTLSNLMEAGELATQAFQPLSDARSSARGRRLMARNLLNLCWHETHHSLPT